MTNKNVAKVTAKIVCLFPLGKELLGVVEKNGVRLPEGEMVIGENAKMAAERIFLENTKVSGTGGANEWEVFDEDIEDDKLLIFMKYKGEVKRVENKNNSFGCINYKDKQEDALYNRVLDRYFLINGYCYGIKNNALK